ncbi:MAG: DUF3800 domain-containing protein [Thermomicrobiales bacterium]|nr:DUF3800 domain-containing protein [Thermomicrobiales bacterium]
MARTFLFVDEAGNFDFSSKGSKYFILTSVALDGCTVGDELLELRRTLVWEGMELADAFHTTTDMQTVRDRVFALLHERRFRIDTTIFEKRKTRPSRQSEQGMYELAWYLHMQYVAPRIANADDELMVVGASISTNRRRATFASAVAKVVAQTVRAATVRTAHRPASTDPCLQVADYCCWAIQRKWERDDPRSYVLIQDTIRSEFEPFGIGRTCITRHEDGWLSGFPEDPRGVLSPAALPEQRYL